MKEGLAELAARLIGLASQNPGQLSLENPDTSLTARDNDDAAAYREVAYLFASYFHERFGDTGTRALVARIQAKLRRSQSRNAE